MHRFSGIICKVYMRYSNIHKVDDWKLQGVVSFCIHANQSKERLRFVPFRVTGKKSQTTKLGIKACEHLIFHKRRIRNSMENHLVKESHLCNLQSFQ